MEKKKSSLAVRMSISLVCGLVAGLLLMFLRENLNSTGKEAVWATINSILFQDITVAGAEKALGIFYIIGQLFIRSLQLVIVRWYSHPSHLRSDRFPIQELSAEFP